jgi:hypothetical protein
LQLLVVALLTCPPLMASQLTVVRSNHLSTLLI